MFSQASVILSRGGVYGEGRHAWRRGVCVVKEVCMAKGKMCGEGGMHGKEGVYGRVCREAIYGSKPWTHQNGGGVCMVEGVRGRGHAWQGAHGEGGVHGKAGGRVAGGCTWQERRPLQRTVRILLECILVLMDFWFHVTKCQYCLEAITCLGRHQFIMHFYLFQVYCPDK